MPGILYSDEQVTLHHGDAVTALRGLPDDSAHAVVTDPPEAAARL